MDAKNPENYHQQLIKKSASIYAFKHDNIFENVNDWEVFDKNLSGSEKS